uniref:OTU domain-containing protein n=1 Tax=Amphimedon queenslandica TaxID=400682 RepID=A0A1X7VK32_AMPQE
MFLFVCCRDGKGKENKQRRITDKKRVRSGSRKLQSSYISRMTVTEYTKKPTITEKDTLKKELFHQKEIYDNSAVATVNCTEKQVVSQKWPENYAMIRNTEKGGTTNTEKQVLSQGKLLNMNQIREGGKSYPTNDYKLLLTDFLSQHIRVLHSTVPDGNCLFRALSQCLLKTEEHHYEVRNLVRFENLNWDVFAKHLPLGKSMKDHMTKICFPGSWGTDLEIIAATSHYKIPAYFCSVDNGTKIGHPIVCGSNDTEYIIDSSLAEGDIAQLTNLTISEANETEFDVYYAINDNEEDPFRIPNIDTVLYFQYSNAIDEFKKALSDQAVNACCSCERLLRKKSVTEAKYLDSEVWNILLDYIRENDPTALNKVMYICNHCKPTIRKNKVPARYVLDGLKCEQLPEELENLVEKTMETLNEVDIDSNHLPNPELYIIINGQPAKSNNVWSSLVDVNKIKAALRN